MYLLKRKISSYSGADEYLGIYINLKEAQEDRVKIIEKLQIVDRWKNQTHHTVDLENDVDLIDISDKLREKSVPKKSQKLFLVDGIDEGFGQILTTLVFVSTDEKFVKEFIQQKEEEGYDEDGQFHYYVYEEMRVK